MDLFDRQKPSKEQEGKTKKRKAKPPNKDLSSNVTQKEDPISSKTPPSPSPKKPARRLDFEESEDEDHTAEVKKKKKRKALMPIIMPLVQKLKKNWQRHQSPL